MSPRPFQPHSHRSDQIFAQYVVINQVLFPYLDTLVTMPKECVNGPLRALAERIRLLDFRRRGWRVFGLVSMRRIHIVPLYRQWLVSNLKAAAIIERPKEILASHILPPRQLGRGRVASLIMLSCD